MTERAARVAICIATYQRPEGLDRLLSAIADLKLPDPAPVLRVVVVDNDPGSQAVADVIERWRTAFDDLVFDEEPQQGISFARNKALDSAGDVDFVALIDDDEAPSRQWLSELLRVQQEFDADVVTGPVLPKFDNEPEAWIVEGEFFASPRQATGSEMQLAFTGNVLYRWEPYGRQQRFSARYARSGSSDTHYFIRLWQQGARIVWADDAVVHEWQPLVRQSVWWQLRRQYRNGLTRAVIDWELKTYPNPRRRSAKEARVRVKDGLRGLVRNPLGPRHEQVRSLVRLAGGVGRIAALLGLWYEEYR